MAHDRAVLVIDRWITAGHLEPAADARSDPDWIFGSAVEGAAADMVIAPGPGPSTPVIVVDDLLDAERVLSESEVTQPIRLVQLRGDRVLVTAPLGEGGQCARCLVERRSARMAPEFLAAHRAGLTQPPPPALQHRNAARLARAMLSEETSSDVCIRALDPLTGIRSEHALIPVPGCPTCDPDGMSAEWSHAHDSAGARSGALLDASGLVGSRTVEPNLTWERHREVVSDLIGIVPVVEPVGPAEFNAFAAGANVIGIDDPAIAASALRNRGGGKGLSPEAARASALAEAIERDALRFRGDEPIVEGSWQDIPGAIHPNEIQLFSDTQLSNALAQWEAGTAVRFGHHVVPRPFDPTRRRQWSAVRSLVTGELSYVPTAKLFVRARREPDDPYASSNGAAAGNTLEEAQLQGLLELIERDAVALWWYPRSLRQTFDLDSWDDPRVIAALAPHKQHGRTWVLDLTSDIGVPAAVAISEDDRIPFSLLGAGAHLDPAIAVARSLAEMAQMKASILSGPPIDAKSLSEAEQAWVRDRALLAEPWVNGSGTASIPSTPIHPTAQDARDDLVERLARAGHDVLWADLTRRDSRLPVVRTFSPGLRHFWRRFGPGRLYEVPVAQGWVPAALEEQDMNPLELPL